MTTYDEATEAETDQPDEVAEAQPEYMEPFVPTVDILDIDVTTDPNTLYVAVAEQAKRADLAEAELRGQTAGITELRTQTEGVEAELLDVRGRIVSLANDNEELAALNRSLIEERDRVRQQLRETTDTLEELNRLIGNGTLPAIVREREVIATIATMLKEEAEDRSWCSEYEDFRQKVNAAVGREVLLSMNYTGSIAIRVNVDATGPRHAWGDVVNAIRSSIGNYVEDLGDSVDGGDWQVDAVEVHQV